VAVDGAPIGWKHRREYGVHPGRWGDGGRGGDGLVAALLAALGLGRLRDADEAEGAESQPAEAMEDAAAVEPAPSRW
jgi:hypothetical protein